MRDDQYDYLAEILGAQMAEEIAAELPYVGAHPLTDDELRQLDARAGGNLPEQVRRFLHVIGPARITRRDQFYRFGASSYLMEPFDTVEDPVDPEDLLIAKRSIVLYSDPEAISADVIDPVDGRVYLINTGRDATKSMWAIADDFPGWVALQLEEHLEDPESFSEPDEYPNELDDEVFHEGE